MGFLPVTDFIRLFSFIVSLSSSSSSGECLPRIIVTVIVGIVCDNIQLENANSPTPLLRYRSDIETLQFQMTFEIPRIKVRAQYESSGVLILVQASGSGQYWGEYGMLPWSNANLSLSDFTRFLSCRGRQGQGLLQGLPAAHRRRIHLHEHRVGEDGL